MFSFVLVDEKLSTITPRIKFVISIARNSCRAWPGRQGRSGGAPAAFSRAVLRRWAHLRQHEVDYGDDATATDDATHKIVGGLTYRMGKTPVISEDFPAFIVNRILLPMINEAVYTLHEGIGSVKDIDTAMKLGANHPMGPLELADFIGLDTCLAVMQVLYDGLADTKYRPCPLLVKYVEAGWLGRKSGKGFYDYSGDQPVPTR